MVLLTVRGPMSRRKCYRPCALHWSRG